MIAFRAVEASRWFKRYTGSSSKIRNLIVLLGVRVALRNSKVEILTHCWLEGNRGILSLYNPV